MSVNNNYFPLLYMLNNEAPASYVGASVGAFNELFLNPSGEAPLSFAAFVAFVITGDYQDYTPDQDSPPDPQWLWGNFDTSGKTGAGWSITLEPSIAGQGTILARVADGAGNVINAQADISGPGLSSPVEHLIMATLIYSTINDPVSQLVLGLNGSLVAATQSDLAYGYTPSPFAARLGADAPTGTTALSPTVQFLSCGYAPIGPFTQGGPLNLFGQMLGQSWRAFYESMGGMNMVTPDYGLDWKHRYNAASLSDGIAASTLKTAYGAFVGGDPSNYAPAAAVLPDIGNKSPALGNPPPTVAPVNLNRSGPAAVVLGAKNIPFYTPPALTFATLPPVPP